MTQVAEGGRVTDQLIFRFKDGSIYEDKTIFSQRGRFRLLSDHLVQRGPSFKHPMETSIDASSGRVTVRYTDDDGKENKTENRPPKARLLYWEFYRVARARSRSRFGWGRAS